MTLKQLLSIFVRGFAMGSADVVPGVSGGTIAFISGIYPRLIKSLTSFDMTAVKLVLRLQFRALFEHVDALFLAVLFLGVFSAIGTLAHGVAYLLETYPVLLWSFFFGLILASALSMLREVSRSLRARDVIPFLTGCGFILFVSTTGAVTLEPSLPMVFLAGCIAISAMLLPGVSGSFLLVLMGLYATMIDAIKSFNLPYILFFVAGAGVGFLGFSRVIRWLLINWYRPTLLFLIGLLLGSLYVVWPWKIIVAELSKNLSPAAYALQVGEPMLVFASLSALVGVGLVVALELVFGRRKGLSQNEEGAQRVPPSV